MKKVAFLLMLLLSIVAKGQDRNVLKNIHSLIENYQYQKALELIATQKLEPKILFEKSICLKALGNYRPAKSILEELTEQFPDDKNIIGELASVNLTLKNWSGAADCFTKLMAIDSSNIYFKIQKADMLSKLGKNKDAVRLYREIYFQKHISCVLNSLGKSYEDMDALDSAQVYYKKAWESDFQDTEPLANYIKVSYRLRNIDAAMDAGNLYVEKDTTNQQINLLNAVTYYLANEHQSAVRLFERCKSLGDTCLTVSRGLGLSYYELHEDSLAYANLKIAFSQDTTNNNVLYSLAATSNNLSQWNEAILYFSKFLKRIIPDDNVLYYTYKGLGSAHQSQGEFQKAILDYETAIKYGIKNQQAIAIAAIAEIYQYKLKDEESALKYYRQYLPYLRNYITETRSKENLKANELRMAEIRLNRLEEYVRRAEATKK